MKLSAFIRKGTGTRRRTTSAGSFFSQSSITGSKALQCGHAYEKNSSTSTLPAGTPGGCGVSTRVKSLPSTGAPGCGWARAAPPGASAAAGDAGGEEGGGEAATVHVRVHGDGNG